MNKKLNNAVRERIICVDNEYLFDEIKVIHSLVNEAFPSKAGQLVLHKTDKQTVAGEKHLLGGRNNMRLSPLDNSNHHFRDNLDKSVPETIEHLNPHYQHCALCRTPRVCWNKK